ncbi:MAG: DUF2004 domain-containing protein [Thermoplasmataceae archaeon]
MEKGLDISFQLNTGNEDNELIEALANLTGYDMKSEMKIDWRIFHVKLEEKRFFKILYSGPKINGLHPHNMEKIRNHFDSISKLEYNEVMGRYHDLLKKGELKPIPIKEMEESYDLWQDKIWQYI